MKIPYIELKKSIMELKDTTGCKMVEKDSLFKLNLKISDATCNKKGLKIHTYHIRWCHFLWNEWRTKCVPNILNLYRINQFP